MTNHQDGIRMSAVKHDDAHSLRVNRTLMPGEIAPRNFWCTCGHQFGEIFDSTARSTYRKHRKTSVSEPCEECDGHGEVRVWSLADVVGFLQPCQACDGHGQVTNARYETPMTLTTGTTVNIGPKGSNNRAHRITHIETTTHGNRKITLVRINDETTWTTTIKPTANRVTWNARMNRVITDAEREQSIEQEALKIIHHEGGIDSTRINHSTLYRLSAKSLVYVSRHYPNGTYDVALTTHGRDLIDTDHTDNSAQESDTITVGDLAHEYGISIQDVTRALGDDTLTDHDGVDAIQARDILNRQRIQVGQTWTNNDYDSDHEVTAYEGNGYWEMNGPGGHHTISDFYLRAMYTLKTTN